MSGLRPKRCNGAGVRPLQLLVRPFGKRAGGGAGGSVAVPLKSHTRPKESDRADDALSVGCTAWNSKISSRFLRWREVLAHCEWPRDDTLIPMPGGGTISEWCLRDLSAAGERPAGQADEGIEKIAEPCETRKQNAWSQGEFVTLELGGEAEESTQKKNRMRRDPTSGGVASATASSTVCRSQTQSLVSGEYNSDEEKSAWTPYTWRRRRLQCLMSRMESRQWGRRRGSLSRRLPTYTSRESRSGVVRLDLLYTWISQR
ncbi:unnamed protein product [Trichogramma brassicae]|uniref:Uncharacterized protein n=1 Tax=Trichogramma brassicae TaxID=86971 RepID=A0A6H5I3Q1_9HYME|nr:unnamed protein product [Trichogramma brassicae]